MQGVQIAQDEQNVLCNLDRTKQSRKQRWFQLPSPHLDLDNPQLEEKSKIVLNQTHNVDTC